MHKDLIETFQDSGLAATRGACCDRRTENGLQFVPCRTARRRSVTINDVAREAGVSRAAVSKVIRNAYGVSPSMRERVEARHRGARLPPQRGRPGAARLELPAGHGDPHVRGRFMTQIVEGAKRALAGTPYQLVLAPAEGPEYDTIESLADGLVDGIVAVSPLVDPAWLENLARRVPIVMLGRHDHARHLRHGGRRRRGRGQGGDGPPARARPSPHRPPDRGARR